MRVTILPQAIIMTKACRAAVSIMAEGLLWLEYCLCGVSYFLPPNYTNIFLYFFYMHHLVMRLKYSFLNTPKQQYFMLLTSGG